MALEEYKRRRSFKQTPEPQGGGSNIKNLQFVIQKHAASHLHYDFRLELKGILKSWAVPKGPSTDPSVSRLAMLVEDHPFDYKDFEGIIPEGNYGAGSVIIWDRGTYEPVEKAPTKEEQEHMLTKQFYSGSIKIKLNGKKLKGVYTLTKMRERGETAWLLVKAEDKFAKKADVTILDKSVVSRKTIEQLAADKSAAKWISNRHSNGIEKIDELNSVSLKVRLKQTPKTKMPQSISPMLSTLTKQVPDSSDYVYEIKWDGYRIISYVNGRTVRMDSRKGLDYTSKYPLVQKALKAVNHKMVVDGEMIVPDEKGLPDFGAIQNYNGQKTPIVYYLFDILWLDGHDLRDLPLTERKQILSAIIGQQEFLKLSESFEDGPALYDQMIKLHLEGIVAKKRDSIYIEGDRGYNWLKIPTRKRQEFVIGGWAESQKSRAFRSLLFGAYSNGELQWIGRSGGGYKEKEMPGILRRLKELEIKESPFVNRVLDTKGATIHWVKPKLVANFEFAAWTESGRIRKPATFLGFRSDKKASHVVREVPKSLEEVEVEEEQENVDVLKQAKNKTRGTTTKTINEQSNWKVLDAIKIQDQETIQIGNCEVTVHDVGRMIWKDVPKAELIQYYHSISRYILPHLKDRPLSLHIKPKGATAPGLYIKDMEGRGPECAEIFTDKRRHSKPGKRNTIDYLICNNEATLLYLINLGCIDINPWMSRKQKPGQPDFINIDLDPTDGDFDKVIETALAAKKLLAKYKLKSFVKTSGKTGLHVYLPVTGITFPQGRAYSEHLGKEICQLVPKIATTEVSIDLRGNKTFVDPSQNDYADTLAAAYSARPFHLPTVSTPLDWKEVKQGLDPSTFTIHTIEGRIQKKGDLFKEVLKKRWAEQNILHLKKINVES
ncbi:MAG TPA: DNA ligase D [Chitinophagaceae bacterium]|nr:DNA ligase D [Chitinophagaceae bacterium]